MTTPTALVGTPGPHSQVGLGVFRLGPMADGRDFDTGYRMGWAQGVADTGARLVAVVAGELGHDHPLVDRMVARLGAIAPPAPPAPPEGT